MNAISVVLYRYLAGSCIYGLRSLGVLTVGLLDAASPGTGWLLGLGVLYLRSIYVLLDDLRKTVSATSTHIAEIRQHFSKNIPGGMVGGMVQVPTVVSADHED